MGGHCILLLVHLHRDTVRRRESWQGTNSGPNISVNVMFPAQVSMAGSDEQSGRLQSRDRIPSVFLEVTSRDVLNLTLTKTSISLMNELAHVRMNVGISAW